MSLVVEFLGLSAVGKSTTATAVEGLLAAPPQGNQPGGASGPRGGAIWCPPSSGERDAGMRRSIRLDRALHPLRHRIGARLADRTGQPTQRDRDYLRSMLARRAWTLRHARRRGRIALLDEGHYQALWSILYQADGLGPDPLPEIARRWARAAPRPDVVVLLRLEEPTRTARGNAREKKARMQRDPRPDGPARAKRLMDDVVGAARHAGVSVVEVSSGRAPPVVARHVVDEVARLDHARAAGWPSQVPP